jgi:predicted amidophosphoribosyltransferase
MYNFSSRPPRTSHRCRLCHGPVPLHTRYCPRCLEELYQSRLSILTKILTYVETDLPRLVGHLRGRL